MDPLGNGSGFKFTVMLGLSAQSLERPSIKRVFAQGLLKTDVPFRNLQPKGYVRITAVLCESLLRIL